ncbi:MAG: type IV pilus assembly protein PilM [Thermoleophilia bacterium]|nr:type IV pilus assembly protein PilM [Thermoleophilia bacterium]
MSTVVALDMGSSAIAGVELRTGREKVSLTKAAVEPIPPGLLHDGEVQQPGELAAELKRFWKAARFSGRRVRLGVANQRVVVRVIDLPALDDERERRAAVEFEAAEHIPIPPDQSVVDFQPIMRYEGDSGPRERIVVVAAHREMIDQLVSVVRGAGLQPVGIDLEAFALLRALQAPPSVLDEGSPDTQAQAVVHVGAEVTHVIVSVDRNCHFTRMIGFGGEQLTRAVEQRTGLPREEAEAVKLACGLLGRPLDGWDADTVAEVRHALALGARPLVREVARSLDYYRSQPFSRSIGGIILSGGTSLCAGIDRYLQQGVGMRVTVGNPLGQVDDAGGVSPEVAARAAVAVGLALDAPGGAR